MTLVISGSVTLVSGGVENVGFVMLVVALTFDAPALRGIFGTDAERVNEPRGVKALRS